MVSGAEERGVIGPRLTRADFAVGAEVLALGLLGRVLVRRLESGEVLAGRIVETEAYLGVQDRASHAYAGRRTARNESMYARPGTSYVYFTYGVHHCFNVVCGSEGEPAAVLVRALEPLLGIDMMRSLRGRPGAELNELCSGPGKLCRALSIDRGLDGVDLVRESRLWIADSSASREGAGRASDQSFVRTARIGIDSAGPRWAGRLLRFCVGTSPHLSVPIAARPGSVPRLTSRRRA